MYEKSEHASFRARHACLCHFLGGYMSSVLSTVFTGITLPNPFLLASAPPTTTPDMIMRAFEAGWGGAVIKTITQKENPTHTNVTPRIQAVRHQGRMLGFANNELGTMKHVDEWLEGIARIKARFPQHALVASLLYGGTPLEDQWRAVAAQCQQAGADALELNFSCPHGCSEEGGGASIAENIDFMRQVLGWVRQSSTLPLWVKLPAMCSLEKAARVCEAEGAQAVTVINTISSLPGIDINTSRPVLAVNGQGAFGGLSGPAIKTIALRCVVQVRKGCGLPVVGVGGIDNWQDAAEFLLAGAGALQVCSAVMHRGYSIIDDLRRGLEQWLETRSFSSLDEAVGQALPHMVAHQDLSRQWRVHAHLHPDTCTRCGACFTSCRDSGYQAITWEKRNVPVVDKEQCSGCGLCAQVCPAGSMGMMP